MKREKIIGTCHICGAKGPLSFEHIPPKKAFNDKPVIRVEFEEAIGLGPDEIIKGPIQQKGAGAYTLCYKCNNKTGSWYGKSFVDWCYQGFDILIKAKGKPSLLYLYHVFPLRILKQIVTMFFSVNNPEYADANPELVEFVLNKGKKYLPPDYRFFVYFNIIGRLRYSGVVAYMSIGTGKKPLLLSEINYPPYGYVMTFNSPPPDERLFEITHFSQYCYNEFRTMNIKLPVLPTHLPPPGDYRTKEKIVKDFRKNVLKK